MSWPWHLARPESTTRVAVVGAGYAGMAAWLELQEVQRRFRLQLTLVNASRYHWYTTELHTLAAGTAGENHVRLALRRVVRPPARLVVDRVQRIDLQGRAVYLGSGEAVPYDYLIAGPGSEPEYFGVRGAREHGLVVGTPGAAAELHRRLSEALAQPEPPHVVVAGGGLTGVELASELADAYGDRIRVTLLEAMAQIMPGFDPYLVTLAGETLARQGVQVRTQAPIAAVAPGRVTLAHGEEIACSLLAWAGGVRGPVLLTASGFAVNRRGRGLVDAFLHAEGHPEVYLVGDAAAWTDPESGHELPPTAQAAVQMWRRAARNLRRCLAWRQERPFRPHLKGTIASLGRHTAVAQVGHEHLAGLPALLLKRGVEALHAYEAGGVLPILSKLAGAAPRVRRKQPGALPLAALKRR